MIKKGKKVSLTAHQNEQRTIEPIVIVSSVGKNTMCICILLINGKPLSPNWVEIQIENVANTQWHSKKEIAEINRICYASVKFFVLCTIAKNCD
jgi:hypothetical protein